MKKNIWLKAKFNSIVKVADLTWKFIIKLENNFEYTAGQFIRIKVNDIIRSYSIASYDSNNNSFELLIVKQEGGKMSKLLFDEIKEGYSLEINGPLGKFILPKDTNRDLFFICTGTGIAPIRSMIQYIHINKVVHKNIYLIFGTRKMKDLLCYDEMIDLKRSINSFHYIPVLSREKWSGETGYVHKQYINLINNEDLEDPIFYLCGWRDMIKEARNNLKGFGFDSKRIKLEVYG